MLLIKETYVNETKGYQYGSTEWYEAYTDKIGKLFLSLQREFGRCVSKMYIDLESGGVKTVGWVFQKKLKYEDARQNRSEDYYIRETWVEIQEKEE